jgi:CheY-like chemotaxis protein
MSRVDKPYVLLVEDNDSTIALMMALLQRDFEIEVATDGADAIDKLKTKAYRAILLDLKMPHVDGYAVLDFLTGAQPDMIPHVLVVTAALTAKEIERVKQYPVCAIIPKPFEVDLLLAAVKHCANPDWRTAGPLISGGLLLFLADLLHHRWMT